MSKIGLCCDECFDLIARRSTSAATMWVSICEAHSKAYLETLVFQDGIALRVLELMGFIMTTDIHDGTILKIRCEKVDDDGSYYCGDICGRK